MSEVYVSVDVEADGPYPGDYSMVSLGAAARVSNRLITFYDELCPISDRWDPEALAVLGLTREHLLLKGQRPVDVMAKFNAWVQALPGRAVFLGFNATFDWQFVNYYALKFGGRNPFGISGCDIKAYFMGKYDTTWADTAKRRIPKPFHSGRRHTHNAKDDAIEQLLLFERIRQTPR